MAQIEIRDAVPEDAAGLVDLRRTIFGESDFMLYAPDEYSDSIEAMSKRIDAFSQSRDSRMILALFDRVSAGFLTVTGSEVPRRRHVAHVVLGVSRAYWGRGAGGAMLKETLRWAATAGVSRLELGVMVDNHRAVELYQRHGFRIEGTRQRAYIVGGRSVDEHIMANVR
jgi:RimJ/RimL family protein N-acetyltransferase